MSYDKYLKENVPQSTQEIVDINIKDNGYENAAESAFDSVYGKFLSEISTETLDRAREITSKYVYDMCKTIEGENANSLENIKTADFVNNKTERTLTELEVDTEEKILDDDLSF